MSTWKAKAVTGIALVVSVLGLSAASTLTLTAPTAPAQTAVSKCSTQVAAVNFEAGQALLDVPEECADEPLNLYVASDSGTETVPVPAHATQVPVGSSNPKDALLTAGTWPLVTSWAISGGPGIGDEPFLCELIPEGTCEVANLVLWVHPDGNAYQAKAEITSPYADRRPWRLTINLSSPEFPFLADEVIETDGRFVVESDSGCTARPRTITAVSASWASVSASSSQNLQFWGMSPVGATGPAGGTVVLSCP